MKIPQAHNKYCKNIWVGTLNNKNIIYAVLFKNDLNNYLLNFYDL